MLGIMLADEIFVGAQTCVLFLNICHLDIVCYLIKSLTIL